MNLEEVNERFRQRKSNDQAVTDCDTLRAMAENLACAIVAMTKESREQSLSVGKIEEAMFWAVAAIERRNP